MSSATESIQERLKLKRTTLDTWSTKEKLSLASLVLRSGDQNWSCVSRNIRIFAEPNRPPDWFSPKNCAQQYAGLLENVETPKRKKRAAGSNEKTEVETPGESIVRKLTAERLEELKKMMNQVRTEYLRVKENSNTIISGEADDRLPQMLQEIEDEKKQKELEKEAHIKWLKEREERKLELERAWKPGSQLMNIRRASSISEPSSEADSPLSEPLNVDVPEESVLTKPTPTSPLLTSLLKSPSTAAQSVSQTTSSILHSAITSPHRGTSPTIASLLSSSPGLPSNLVMPPSNVSPNLKNLVSNAIASSFNEEHKVVPQSPSQGAPTLSMLLELPPSLPGKPLPMLKPPPTAPPPYSEHLGPPPPYSQATEYLQKQRAEQLAAQSQANASKARLKEDEIKTTPPPPNEANLGITTTPPSTAPVTVRRGSLKGRRLDLQGEAEAENTNSEDATKTPKSSPVKEKEVKRILHNTSDHDYVETPIKEKEKSPVKQEAKPSKKVETDVFEFDELKEGYDKFDLMMKDSKMSYLKSNAQRMALKKEAETNNQKKNEVSANSEPKSYLRDPDKVVSPIKESRSSISEDLPLRTSTETDLPVEENSGEIKKEIELKSPKNSPIKDADSRRSSRNSTDNVDKKDELPEEDESVEASEERRSSLQGEEKSKRKNSETEEIIANKDCNKELVTESKTEEPAANIDFPFVEENENNKKKSVQPEEDRTDDPEDAEVSKEEDTSSLMTDTIKSEKADFSNTEDEKSNDAPPKTYIKKRGPTSHSDSVPSSPGPITEEEKEYKTWKKAVMLVYTRLAGHKFASLFLKPITDDQAPSYSSIVRRPMDLSTVKRNIENGNIRTTSEFQHDVMLMFLNALMYNKQDDHVHTMTKEMQADSLEQFQMLLQVTDESAPSRRETRTQQNADVKNRTAEKSTKLNRTTLEADKSLGGTGESKQRINRFSVKNSPRSSPRSSVSSDKTPNLPVKRKRTLGGNAESTKKKIKVDE